MAPSATCLLSLPQLGPADEETGMQKTDETELAETIARLEARIRVLENGGAPGESRTPREFLHDKTNELADAVTAYIEKHPVRSAVIAFLLGVVLASRRGGR